ncbi:hypothetical protein H9X96_17025 [Pedobacter sp. N36a]|uniref:hypothetical protein n=1 Tax=Pedobacter sp. N36a TaxID=2767996 RepID=UPI00165755C9|nr:hypothetical protein [Pedobacter sp. N36a]MBC8987473.1 hypothetical protein [Pedobacter sp. N36a]
MKTSNMLIVAAIIVTLGMLTTYNFSLKAAYQAGEYKNRFHNSEFTEFKNIETLNVTAANLMAIVVEPGQKEGIWVRNRIKDRLVLKQDGTTLTIGLTDEARKTSRSTGADDIVLVLNSLNKLDTKAFFLDKTEVTDGRRYGGEVALRGIKATNLELQLGSGTAVSMDKVILKNLKAVVGAEGDAAVLDLNTANEIEFADFEVPGASRLSLNNPKIVKTRYNLSDNATVTLNGAALQVIKNQ